jgi:hypothetical protein
MASTMDEAKLNEAAALVRDRIYKIHDDLREVLPRKNLARSKMKKAHADYLQAIEKKELIQREYAKALKEACNLVEKTKAERDRTTDLFQEIIAQAELVVSSSQW